MKKTLLVIWFVYIFSLLEFATYTMVSRFQELIGFPMSSKNHWLALAITMVYILAVFTVIYKKYREDIKNISYINILELTILIIIDVAVVWIISTFVGMVTFDESRVVTWIVYISIFAWGYVQLPVVVVLYIQCNIYKNRVKLAEVNLNEQKQQYQQLEYRERETRKFRHDVRSHMYMLSEMVKRKEYDDVETYLEKLDTKIDSLESDAVVQK